MICFLFSKILCIHQESVYDACARGRPSSLWSMWVPRVMQKGCAWMLKVVLSPSWHKFFARNLSQVTRKMICSVQLSLSFHHLSGRTGFTLVIIKLSSFLFNCYLVCWCTTMLSAWKLRTDNNEWNSATNEEHFHRSYKTCATPKWPNVDPSGSKHEVGSGNTS